MITNIKYDSVFEESRHDMEIVGTAENDDHEAPITTSKQTINFKAILDLCQSCRKIQLKPINRKDVSVAKTKCRLHNFGFRYTNLNRIHY